MTGISAITSTAQLWKLFGNAGAANGSLAIPTDSDAANSAGSASTTQPSLPSAPQISMQTMLALQSADPVQTPQRSLDQTTGQSVEEKFLAEAHKSPMQRLREQIMQSLGVSEDQLAQMPPEQRRAVEDKIAQIIREKIREGSGVDKAGASPSSDAGATIAAVA